MGRKRFVKYGLQNFILLLVAFLSRSACAKFVDVEACDLENGKALSVCYDNANPRESADLQAHRRACDSAYRSGRIDCGHAPQEDAEQYFERR
jgi:hypothetical protein